MEAGNTNQRNKQLVGMQPPLKKTRMIRSNLSLYLSKIYVSFVNKSIKNGTCHKSLVAIVKIFNHQ